MFNFLVNYQGWAEGKGSLHISRVLEFTDELLTEKFKFNNEIRFQELINYPALFIEESFKDSGAQLVRVGKITSAKLQSNEVHIEYSFDTRIPMLTNEKLESIANDLNIFEFEFSRTHWSLKDVDLYKVLLLYFQSQKTGPKVFTLNSPEAIDLGLVSVMMPFDSKFDSIYQEIKNTCGKLNIKCNRADDIWKHDSIVQDIVSLIDSSNIVVADCTGRNPNVFYEIGIAHTLGRNVILITQNMDDIPFDLRHLRVITYLNNGEGLANLSEKLQKRISQIIDN